MKRILLLLGFVTVTVSGCASAWTPDYDLPGKRLHWNDASGFPLIEQSAILRGFRETGRSFAGLVRSVVFGRSNDSMFKQPVAVAVGKDGRIAVADAGCACVHLYYPNEQRYLRLFGSGRDRLSSPVSVVFDEQLRLYVSDSAGGTVYVYSSTGDAEQVLHSAGSTALRRPTGLAFAGEKKTLYVTDTAAHAVYALKSDYELAFRIGGRGIEPGAFNFPTHLSARDDGTLYVTDAMNFRVQSFDGTGRLLSVFGRHGDGSGDLAMPKGIAVDRKGVVYVVDGLFDNVQLFNQKGDFLLTVGGRGRGSGEFWLPSGIFLDEQDKLYVCDTYNQRVQIFQIVRPERP